MQRKCIRARHNVGAYFTHAKKFIIKNSINDTIFIRQISLLVKKLFNYISVFQHPIRILNRKKVLLIHEISYIRLQEPNVSKLY